MTKFHGKIFIFFATKIVNLEQQTNIQPNFSFFSATFSQFVTKNNSNQNFSVPFMSPFKPSQAYACPFPLSMKTLHFRAQKRQHVLPANSTR